MPVCALVPPASAELLLRSSVFGFLRRPTLPTFAIVASHMPLARVPARHCYYSIAGIGVDHLDSLLLLLLLLGFVPFLTTPLWRVVFAMQYPSVAFTTVTASCDPLIILAEFIRRCSTDTEVILRFFTMMQQACTSAWKCMR